LVGIFHYGDPPDTDPPLPMTAAERRRILESRFTLLDDRPCPSGLSVFAGHQERWQVWRMPSMEAAPSGVAV